MIDPAFSHMRINTAFHSMQTGVTEYRRKLDERAKSGQTFSLDFAVSELMADIVCRTIFSCTLGTKTAQDAFDPLRFHASQSSDDEGEGVLMSFDLGQRVCVGAAFATIDSTLIIAEFIRRYDFSVLDADKVRPVARLTTQPATEIFCRVHRYDRHV